jgi:DNA-binding winged helix-turn-helix (wHTH) protein
VIYLFEGNTFDTERRELRRAGALCPLEPQLFDLLEYLIRNRHRVVARDDVLKAVWNGRIVSEAALDTRISAARRLIGDDGTEQRLLKTIRTRGFRFVGEVQEEDSRAARTRISWRTIRGRARRCSIGRGLPCFRLRISPAIAGKSPSPMVCQRSC